nr:hypothetical protein [Tanacetum cinerariifolium]
VVVWPVVDEDEGIGGGDGNDDIDGGAGEVDVAGVATGWQRCVDDDGSEGCGEETKVVAARGRDWCGGSSRSGWDECFWGRRKSFPAASVVAE